MELCSDSKGKWTYQMEKVSRTKNLGRKVDSGDYGPMQRLLAHTESKSKYS